MTAGRVPLWIDVSQAAPHEKASLKHAAKQVNAERVLDASEHVQRITIRSADDQRAAAEAAGTVVVDSDDWTIIPLENLIAARRDRPGTLFAVARTTEEALRFRDTLEIGVHGIVLSTTDPGVVAATDRALRERGPRTDDAPNATDGGALASGTITAMEDAGPGERVCIDCTERFQAGEGLLIGSTARSFVLVHAETLDSEYVNARPFRVNAGAIHSYIMGPDDCTQYLSELAAGSKVQAVHTNGDVRTMTVGRAKVEHRPHTLIRWSSDRGEGSAVLQTAETVRLVTPDGTLRAITELRVGDAIMVRNESSARHFGMPVKERLVET